MKDSDRATKVLQKIIHTLMETGVRNRDIIAALDNLSDRARRREQTELPASRKAVNPPK